MIDVSRSTDQEKIDIRTTVARHYITQSSPPLLKREIFQKGNAEHWTHKEKFTVVHISSATFGLHPLICTIRLAVPSNLDTTGGWKEYQVRTPCHQLNWSALNKDQLNHIFVISPFIC